MQSSHLWKKILKKKLFCFTIFTQTWAGYDTRSIFKRSLTGLNSEFSFSLTSCLTKADPSLPYYLPIAGGRIFGFIPFPRVLVLCEMQSVSSRIWTRVAMSISYDDNHYTTGTSLFCFTQKRFPLFERLKCKDSKKQRCPRRHNRQIKD